MDTRRWAARGNRVVLPSLDRVAGNGTKCMLMLVLTLGGGHRMNLSKLKGMKLLGVPTGPFSHVFSPHWLRSRANRLVGKRRLLAESTSSGSVVSHLRAKAEAMRAASCSNFAVMEVDRSSDSSARATSFQRFRNALASWRVI